MNVAGLLNRINRLRKYLNQTPLRKNGEEWKIEDITINPKKKTATEYSCQYSYHNGDPFDEKTEEILFEKAVEKLKNIEARLHFDAVKLAEKRVLKRLAEKQVARYLRGD